MHTIIQPGAIAGTIAAPPSKSVAQRAIACALLRRGMTVLRHTGDSADVRAALNTLTAMGAQVSASGDTATILPEGGEATGTVHCGESGLAARMFAPLLALGDRPVILTGSGSLLQRPMSFPGEVLPQLGVSVGSAGGYLPLTICGPLQPKDITVDGSLSSQFITGLILAYTAAGAAGVTLTVQNPVSMPYLALTLRVMEDMGLPVPVAEVDYSRFRFSGGLLPERPLTYTVEGDWSAAAFLLVAGAIAGDLSVTGLDVFTEQGDKAVLEALMDAGAQLSVTTESITVRRSPLKAFHFDATDRPDLFPPLAVLAACCSGTSVIEGVHRLFHKESNRAVTLQEELGRMDIDIRFQDDLMLIEGGHPVRGATVSAHNDHRIAMACAVAALRADGPVTIQGAEAVAKSWPGFFRDLPSLGVNIITDE